MHEVTTDSGLKYQDMLIGEGDEAAGRGCFVTVHYTGWLEDGTKFDSSVDRGEPFGFPLAVGHVIQGRDEGGTGMKYGGKPRLTVPSKLGYGSRGAGDVIPPHATLVFEVELLEVSV